MAAGQSRRLATRSLWGTRARRSHTQAGSARNQRIMHASSVDVMHAARLPNHSTASAAFFRPRPTRTVLSRHLYAVGPTCVAMATKLMSRVNHSVSSSTHGSVRRTPKSTMARGVGCRMGGRAGEDGRGAK